MKLEDLFISEFSSTANEVSEREVLLLRSIANAIEKFANQPKEEQPELRLGDPQFTKRAKRVLHEYANQEAKKFGHDYIGTTSIALGLIREEDSVACKLLKNLNIDFQLLKLKLLDLGRIEVSDGTAYTYIEKKSMEEALRLKHSYIGTEHILLAMLSQPYFMSSKVFSEFHLNYSVIKGEILRILGVSPPRGKPSK